MTAAFLLRLTLQGVLEQMHAHQMDHHAGELAWPAPLNKKAAVIALTGGGTLSTREIIETAAMLSRPSATPEELIHRAIRLGLLGISLADQGRAQTGGPGARKLRAGYGLLAGDAIRIGMTGHFSDAFVRGLVQETAASKNRDVRLISLGDWIPAGEGFLPSPARPAKRRPFFPRVN